VEKKKRKCGNMIFCVLFDFERNRIACLSSNPGKGFFDSDTKTKKKYEIFSHHLHTRPFGTNA